MIVGQLYRYFHHNGGLTIVSRLEELFAEVDAGHHIAAALLQPHVRVVLKAGGGHVEGGDVQDGHLGDGDVHDVHLEDGDVHDVHVGGGGVHDGDVYEDDVYGGDVCLCIDIDGKICTTLDEARHRNRSPRGPRDSHIGMVEG